jgi:etoposide-induced 2.4 mRNA
MESLKIISLSIFDGFIDSIKNIYVIFYIDKTINQKLEKANDQNSQQSAKKKANKEKEKSKEKKSNVAFRVFQCCALNGGLFLLSILFFYNLLLPFLKFVTTRLVTEPGIWTYINSILSWIFSCLWVVPLFLLSKIFNFFWFQDIADATYEFRRGKRTLIPSISLLLADVVFSLIIQTLFILQGTFISYIPYLGRVLCFIHICLLYSLYSFEYKWFNQGYELHRRLKLVEYNWPYYIGFGLYLGLLTELSDSFIVKGCIFSMFFPLLIISSIDSAPTQRIDFPIPFFSLVVALPNSFVNRKLKSISNRSSTTPTRNK